MSRAAPANRSPDGHADPSTGPRPDSAEPLEPAGDTTWTRRAKAGLRAVRVTITRPPNVRPYLVGELVVILFLLKLYDLVREHADLRKSVALHNASDLFSLEKWLHIDIEPSINHWTVDHRAFSYIASYWYQFGHITVTMIVLVWCWWWRPAAYRSFRNALVLINLAGLTVFLLLPLAPPRLLPGAGFIDADRLAGFGSNDVGPVTADQFGAFPSLHIAWAVWTAVLAFSLMRHRRIARLWIIYPFVTLTAIVATGNHFVLDAVAGALIALAALEITRGRWSRHAR